MRAASLLAGLLLVGVVSPGTAQTPECSAHVGNAHRVCAAAVDGTRAFHPVMGILVSGGNPALGSAGNLGGFGHGSFTIRANAVSVVLPDLNYDGSSSTVAAGDELFAPAPLMEGAIGIYKGLPTGLGAVDLLTSAQILPVSLIDNLTIDADARRIGEIGLGLGFGARIGVLNGVGPVPAVSVSIMRRDLPRITYGSMAAGDRYSYGVDLRAVNLRIIASKHLAVADFAAGLGWDKYTGDAIIQFRDPITSLVAPNVPVELNDSRVLGFLNAGLSLSKVRLTGEIGYQGGKDQNLSTTFEEFDTKKGKFFAGLGLRVSF
jgi:hypothetical protein